MLAIVDVEGNGLLPELTKMWCIIVNPIEDDSMGHYDIFVPDEYVSLGNPSKLDIKPSESVHLHPLSTFKEYSKKITKWVGHNLINYDSRAMLKLGYLEEPIKIKNVVDTLILSQISQPDRQGGHGLKSWGMRFEDYKGDWHDFSMFDWDMVNYCLQDVRVTRRLYLYMMSNTKNFSTFSIRLEHAMRGLLDEMETNGFALDEQRAHMLYVEIKDYCDRMERQIQNDFPPEKVYYKKLYPRVTAKGDLHGQDAKTIAAGLYDKGTDELGEYFNFYRIVPFNPRSTGQIIDRMNQLGWNPVVFNNPTENQVFKEACKFLNIQPETFEGESKEKVIKRAEKKGFDSTDIKGSPQVCEENFETLPETAPASAKNIAEWFLYDKRIQKLEEWFRETNPKTGCIHGKVFGVGARTHRMTHRNPNMANISTIAMAEKKFKSLEEAKDFISKLKYKTDLLKFKETPDENGEYVVEHVVWGKDGKYATDMRACFTTRNQEKRKLVGVDLSGIQLRAFAHYANDKDYSEQILSGDIHAYNRDILSKLIEQFCKLNGIKADTVEFLTKNPKGRRGMAKTFIYAYLFGAGNKKVGSIFGFPESWQLSAGKFIREGFVTSISGLEAFKKTIKKWANQGFMVALDGRLISLPSEHYALSIALQSFEAIVMKYALILASKIIKDKGLDALLVGIIHDESQWDVRADQAEEVGKIVVECMEEAGRYFKSNVPLTGEYSIGNNWADSH